MKKKVIMAAAVLCLGILLGTGCGIKDIMPSSSNGETEEDIVPSLSDEECEEKMMELAAFCEEHREKLNEMSEYFLDAVENVSDYEDDEKLPYIDELAGTFTDEESKEVLDKLHPYYPLGYGSEFKQVYYSYEGYSNALFMAVYIEADGEELEVFINNMSTGWIDVRKIDKHLFVVLESWPYV